MLTAKTCYCFGQEYCYISISAIVQITLAATVRFFATYHALYSLLSNCCLNSKNSVDVSLSSKTVYESRKMASLLMFGSSDKPASLIHSPVNIILNINDTFYCIHSVHFTFLLIFITQFRAEVRIKSFFSFFLIFSIFKLSLSIN